MADLITLAEAKAYCGVSGSDDDVILATFIAAAQVAMEKGCGRCLRSTSVTETLNGTGIRSLWLRESPESITSIHVDSDRDWGASSLIDSDDYLTDGCRVEYLDHIWTVGRMNVRVVYSAGFTTTPDDVKLACQLQVSRMYSQWKRAKEGLDIVESENVQGWTRKYTAESGLDPAVKDILKGYRPSRL